MAIQYAEPLDRTFHALGDGTRRAMISLLAQRGECTASEIGAPFEIAQPTASRHIRVLEEAGLVSRRVEGRTHRFRVEPVGFDEVRGWIDAQRAFWQTSLDALDRYLKQVQQDQEGSS